MHRRVQDPSGVTPFVGGEYALTISYVNLKVASDVESIKRIQPACRFFSVGKTSDLVDDGEVRDD